MKWPPLISWFITEANYFQFLEIYLDFTQNKQNIPSNNFVGGGSTSNKKLNPTASVPKEDFLKVTNKIHDSALTSKNQQNPMTIEEILQQTKDINLILDKMDENKHKQMEEEIKKMEVFNLNLIIF